MLISIFYLINCQIPDKNLCVLEAIQVTPIANKKTMKPDESMCASYEYEKE